MDQEPYDSYMRRMYKEAEMGDVINHLTVLKNRHHDLDKRIEALVAERAPDQYVTSLKKEKLKIKEEITKIEADLL